MSRIARIVKSPLFLGSVVIGATGAGYAGYYYSHDIQKILQNYGIENQSEKAYNALGEATTGLKKALHKGLESAGFVATDDLDKPKPIEKPAKVKDIEKKAEDFEQQKPAPAVKLTTVEELAPPQPTAMPTTPMEAKQIDIKPIEIHKEPPRLEATPPQKMEVQMQSSDTSLEIESKIRKERQKWEADADAQLKRIAQEHAEHLQKVIKTQKQLHDIENEHRIEERVKIEQNKFGKQIETAVGKLNEIEEALNSRSAQDLENRRAKIFWTCCQNLMESLVSGGEKAEQYSVVLNEVKFIKNLAENDDFAQSICNCFPEQAVISGIATENGLKQRFAKVYKLARRTAQIDENGGGPFQYFTSWLHSIFVLQFASAKYSAEDKIDLNTYEPYELLGRIKQFVANGDFTNAVKLANLLRGESASIFHDWISDAQLHLHSRFLAEILLSHAQVSSIRTTY